MKRIIPIAVLLFFIPGAVMPLLAQVEKRDPVSLTYIYHLETGIDGGGDLATHFFSARAGLPLFREQGRVIALSASYRFNSYDFTGGRSGSFAALNPWEEIHTLQLGMPVIWDIGDQWTFFGIPTLRSVGEDGARFEDTISGGVITGVAYRFGERLTLGPGIGYISQLEDDASIFPVLLINWKLSESLSLSTGPGEGATLGPGLTLNWQYSEATRFSIGSRYERLRFRLSENSGASEDGVGEDRSVPVYAAISHRFNSGWRVMMLGGVSFGGKLELSNQQGSSLRKVDYDPSPFLGINTSFSF